MTKAPATSGLSPLVTRDAFRKGAILFLIFLASFFLGFLALLILDLPDSAVQIVAGVFFWGSFYLATRFFRAPGESASPRPFWKVTASPVAATVCALLVVASAVSNFFSPYLSVPVLLIDALVLLVLVGNIFALKASGRQA